MSALRLGRFAPRLSTLTRAAVLAATAGLLFGTAVDRRDGASERVVSAQVASCDRSVIRAPFTGDTVRESVSIYGSAEIGSFIFYKLEWATQNNPEVWSAVSSVIEQPVRNGVLDRWDTRNVPDDVYRLKLTVVDDAHQEVCRFTAERLTVRNTSVATSEATSVAEEGEVTAVDRPTIRETPLPTAVRSQNPSAEPPAMETAAPTPSTVPITPSEVSVEASAEASATTAAPVETDAPEPTEAATPTSPDAAPTDSTSRLDSEGSLEEGTGEGDAPIEGGATVVSRRGSESTDSEADTVDSDSSAAGETSDGDRIEDAAEAFGLNAALRSFGIGFALVLVLAAVAWRIGTRRSTEA